jgi:hypothetical protein
MDKQIYGCIAVVTLSLCALVLANYLRDRGVAHWVARRLAAVLGGIAFLMAVLWLEAGMAIGVVSALTLGIATVRVARRQGLRGVSGDRPSQNWSEVTFAAAGTMSLLVGWGLLGDRWLGFLPVSFMAWGDNTAGIARDTFWRNHVTSLWPLMAMGSVCLGTAVFYQPYWIGAVGAIVATAAERYRLKIRFWDDNLNVVAAALLAMSACLWISNTAVL